MDEGLATISAQFLWDVGGVREGCPWDGNNWLEQGRARLSCKPGASLFGELRAGMGTDLCAAVG